jgi:hypothetical protein
MFRRGLWDVLKVMVIVSAYICTSMSDYMTSHIRCLQHFHCYVGNLATRPSDVSVFSPGSSSLYSLAV